MPNLTPFVHVKIENSFRVYVPTQDLEKKLELEIKRIIVSIHGAGNKFDDYLLKTIVKSKIPGPKLQFDVSGMQNISRYYIDWTVGPDQDGITGVTVTLLNPRHYLEQREEL